MSTHRSHDVLVPLDDPVRWAASRMRTFGLLILLGMAVYAVVETANHLRQSAIEPVAPSAQPKFVPLPQPKPVAPKRDISAGALIAKANDVFVGTPIYDKDGATVVGYIRAVDLDAQGQIAGFKMQWFDEKGAPANTANVVSSEIDWGGDDRLVTSGAWASATFDRGQRLRGVLKDQARFLPEAQPPAKASDR